MERDVIRQTPDQPGLLVLGNASVKVQDMEGLNLMQQRDGVIKTEGNIRPVNADHGACCLPQPSTNAATCSARSSRFCITLLMCCMLGSAVLKILSSSSIHQQDPVQQLCNHQNTI
jgi:hypothetical protein